MIRLALLGSTGSIGLNTLAVVAEHPDRFEVTALAAGSNVELLADQIRAVHPALVSVAGEEERAALLSRLAPDVRAQLQVECGPQGAEAVAASGADVVVSAMVGAAGLGPTLAAIRSRARVALANKESLVAAGELCMAAVRQRGATVIPVDSEHSALFQVLQGQRVADVRRLLLTASGGPFRARRDLSRVTVDEALAHPTWSMGPKVTVDSATLMNKGLEVIAARWLFGVAAERIEVVIHPQSVVHSLVELVDGALLAQLGPPDMRLPIAYALTYPERLRLAPASVPLPQLGPLTFEAPDRQRFPCLELAYQALATGGTAPAVLSAANEVAVEAFLARRLPFLEIPTVVGATLEAHRPAPADALEAVLEADRWARQHAAEHLLNHSGGN